LEILTRKKTNQQSGRKRQPPACKNKQRGAEQYQKDSPGIPGAFFWVWLSRNIKALPHGDPAIRH
jgi:hypothetical protein